MPRSAFNPAFNWERETVHLFPPHIDHTCPTDKHTMLARLDVANTRVGNQCVIFGKPYQIPQFETMSEWFWRGYTRRPDGVKVEPDHPLGWLAILDYI